MGVTRRGFLRLLALVPGVAALGWPSPTPPAPAPREPRFSASDPAVSEVWSEAFSKEVRRGPLLTGKIGTYNNVIFIEG